MRRVEKRREELREAAVEKTVNAARTLEVEFEAAFLSVSCCSHLLCPPKLHLTNVDKSKRSAANLICPLSPCTPFQCYSSHWPFEYVFNSSGQASPEPSIVTVANASAKLFTSCVARTGRTLRSGVCVCVCELHLPLAYQR